MKVLIVLSLAAVAMASLEPAGYRPPGSSQALSSKYLPASQYSQHSAPSNQYLPANHYSSQSTPSNQYLPANHYSSQSTPSNQYLPANRYSSQSTPSNQYLPAAHREPSVSQWASASGSSSSASRYNAAPSAQYLPSAAKTPSSLYLPASDSSSFGRYSSPTYSPASSTHSSNRGSPSNKYLPAYESGSSNAGYRYSGSEESNAPAKYEFEYEVKDQPSGNDFGHKETRDGDNTQGVYYVVLPDGRKQVVHYNADNEGYKPRISYEDLHQGYTGNNGYNSNNRYQQHQQHQQHRQHAAYPQGPY